MNFLILRNMTLASFAFLADQELDFSVGFCSSLQSLISVQVFERYQKVVPDSISTNKENLLAEVWAPHQTATRNLKLDQVLILTCVSHQGEVELVAILPVEMALSIVIINTVNQWDNWNFNMLMRRYSTHHTAMIVFVLGGASSHSVLVLVWKWSSSNERQVSWTILFLMRQFVVAADPQTPPIAGSNFLSIPPLPQKSYNQNAFPPRKKSPYREDFRRDRESKPENYLSNDANPSPDRWFHALNQTRWRLVKEMREIEEWSSHSIPSWNSLRK